MPRLIPNENTDVRFILTMANYKVPTVANVTSGVVLTPWLMSLNATTTGNTVPTPSLDTLFETSIAGTVQGAFTMDMYRDEGNDTAYTTLPRKTSGFIMISRFGGSHASILNQPIIADIVEVWPILVVSRANSNLANNTVLTFTVTCSIPREPAEAVAVVA